ncbi:hypothetical protein FRC03_004718 [Tulasnella sp. 419]|nr:hypothetical protein FRC03_004718 [Tulasnella sp. 419]
MHTPTIYVEFWSTASAARALETLKSSQPLVIDGQEIAVDFASFPHDQSTDEVSIEQPAPQDLHSTPSRSICVQFKGDRNQPRSILANEIKQLLGELPGLQSFRQRRAVISCIWVTYGSEENASAAIDMLRSHPKLGHLVSAGYAHETRIKKEPSKRLLIQCDHREDPKAIYRFVQGLDGYLSCQQVREASGFQASRFIAEFHSSKAAADAMDFMESYPSPHDSILAVSFIHPRESLPDHRSNVLFVDNVSLSATQSDLQRIFGSFKGFRGLMLRHRPQRRHLQRHEGWGYVEFSSAFAADAARSATDGKSLRGSIIQVSFSENHSQQDTIAIVKPNRKYGPSGKDSPKSNALFIKGIADVALEDVEDAFSDYSGYDQAIMLSDKAKGSTPHCKRSRWTVDW